MKSFKSCLTLGIVLMMSSSYAQNFTSVGVGNYHRTQSVLVSPSLSGYSKYNWHVNLAGGWANVNNNYLALRVPYSLYRAPNRIPEQYLMDDGNPEFEREWIYEDLNGRRKHISAGAHVLGPSFSFNVGNLSIGMFTQAQAGARVVGVSENLAHAVYNEFDSAQGAFRFFNPIGSGRNNEVEDLNITVHSHAAVGLNLAYKIPMKHDRFLIPGISLKRAFGFAGASIQTEDVVFNTNFRDTVFVEPTSMSLKYWGEEETATTWGIDLGFTYVFNRKIYKRNRPYTKNKTLYHSKISLAILDMGSFLYDEAYQSSINLNNQLAFNTDSFNLDINENNYPEVLDSLVSIYGTYQERVGRLKVGLPTRLVLSSDFQLRPQFFVSATLTQSLRRRRSEHMRHQNTLMVAPRWESPYFEVSTPLLWAYDYRAFRLGLSARLGPLYLGTNSLLPFLYTRGFRDLDIFAGIAFGNIPNFGVLSWLEQRHEKRVARRKAKGCATF